MSALSETMFTREELALLFRVDPQTVSRWVRDGRLPAPLRVGRQLLWRRETLDRFLAHLEGPTHAS